MHRNNLHFAKIKNPFEHFWEGGEVSPFRLQKGLIEDSTSAVVTSLLRRLINLFNELYQMWDNEVKNCEYAYWQYQ